MIPAFHDYHLEPKITKCGDLLYTKKEHYLLNFVGYCHLASFKKVHPENTGEPKSARAFCCLLRPMENENFSFSIGLDNRKALALFGCPVFSGHNFIYYFYL